MEASMISAARYGAELFWSRLRAVICILAVLYLVAPLVIVLIISFSSAPFLTFPPPGFSMQWYRNLFGDPTWFGSLLTSVKILIPTAIISTAIGTAASYGLARSHFLGKQLLTGFIMAPMVVPVIIVAIGVFGVFRKIGLFGNLPGLIIAHTVLT